MIWNINVELEFVSNHGNAKLCRICNCFQWTVSQSEMPRVFKSRIFGIETNQTNNLENNDIICTYFIYSSFLLINMFL